MPEELPDLAVTIRADPLDRWQAVSRQADAASNRIKVAPLIARYRPLPTEDQPTPEWVDLPGVLEMSTIRVPAPTDDEPVVTQPRSAAVIEGPLSEGMAYMLQGELDRRRIASMLGQLLAYGLHVASPDAYVETHELERTDRCWKNTESGYECGEEADPKSATGVCSKHLAEIKGRYAT